MLISGRPAEGGRDAGIDLVDLRAHTNYAGGGGREGKERGDKGRPHQIVTSRPTAAMPVGQWEGKERVKNRCQTFPRCPLELCSALPSGSSMC